MNIVVSGATGYIGSNLVRKLSSLGHKICIISREDSKVEQFNDIKNQIKIYQFNGKTEELCNAFCELNPDIVIHLASLFVSEHDSSQIEDLINSNLRFSTQLMEASIKSNVKYFINTGTQWQNYNSEKYNPVNLYAATKQAFDSICKYYLEISDIKMLTIKLPDTYGVDDPRHKIINLLIDAYKFCKTLDMSKGEQEIALLYIDDVINAFLIAIEKIQSNICKKKTEFLALPSEIYSLKDTVSIFEKITECKLDINWGKRPYRKREMMNVYIGQENILEDVKTVSLQEGIKKILISIEDK